MAQSLTAKRIEVAEATVASSTALFDAANGLAQAKIARDQSGAFTDDELQAVPDLAHLTAFLVGTVLDNLTTDLTTWLTGHVGDNVANPIRRDLLVQMRR